MWEFVCSLLHFRNHHECLRPLHYFSGAIDAVNSLADIAWHRVDGNIMSEADWERTDFLGWRINARQELAVKRTARVESIYVAYNCSASDFTVNLPSNVADKRWYRVLDTDNSGGWMSANRNFEGGRTLLEREYWLHGRSILVAVEK
jgi:pullulanase/glycogen debranching enzyme